MKALPLTNGPSLSPFFSLLCGVALSADTLPLWSLFSPLGDRGCPA